MNNTHKQRTKVLGLDIGIASIAVVAGVNLGLTILQLIEGGDPFGYANAFIIAILWAVAMLRNQLRREDHD